MRTILILLGLCGATLLGAAPAQTCYRVSWDPNAPADAVTNYSVYLKDASFGGWVTNFSCGTNTKVFIYLLDGTVNPTNTPNVIAPWTKQTLPRQLIFAATAANEFGESEFSEFVTFNNRPVPPKTLLIEMQR